MKQFAFFLLLSGLVLNPAAFAAKYRLDADHTTVSFKVRHLVTQVRGNFNQFEGWFDFEPGKPDSWKAEATIQAASIDTNVKERDKHLRSADFFDVEKFPTLTFKSTGVRDATEESAKLDGILSIHGVEKEVTLDLEIHGVVKDPWGGVHSGFTATTQINRKDFGLGWNQKLETGGVLVGDQVKIIIEVEGLLEE